MEILVLSDSHGKVDHMVRAVEQFHPRQVLHLGDCVRDAQALERQFPQLPVTMVDRKSTRLNSSHYQQYRMPSSA